MPLSVSRPQGGFFCARSGLSILHGREFGLTGWDRSELECRRES